MSFRAQMQVQHSSMERRVYLRLHLEGYYPKRDIEYPVPTKQNPKLSTTPDLTFEEENVEVYLDHFKVHFKRQEKDKRLRYLLKKRYGKQVLSLTYYSNTDSEEERLVAEIKAFLEAQ